MVYSKRPLVTAQCTPTHHCIPHTYTTSESRSLEAATTVSHVSARRDSLFPCEIISEHSVSPHRKPNLMQQYHHSMQLLNTYNNSICMIESIRLGHQYCKVPNSTPTQKRTLAIRMDMMQMTQCNRCSDVLYHGKPTNRYNQGEEVLAWMIKQS